MTAREIFNLRARQQRIRKMMTPKPKAEIKPKPEEKMPEGYKVLRDFCTERGISETSVYNAIKAGRLPTIKVGRNRCIRPEDYDAYRKEGTERRALAARSAQEWRKIHARERREGRS